MRRRTALKLLLSAAGAAGLVRSPLGLSRAAYAAEEIPHTVIGFSQGGQPLVIHHLGAGARRVFVLGGQHGWPERNTIELATFLLDHYRANGHELSPGLGLDLMVVANPDGADSGSRQFLSGVDPNRNWGGPDWQSDAWDSNAQFRTGLGGPQPFSEQETRALRDWVVQRRPAFIVNYHSQGGFMFGGGAGLGGELAAAYAEASGYHRPQPSPGGGGSGALGYRATGSMGVWQRGQGLDGIFIELASARDPEIGRNLAGLRAALGRLAALG